MPASQLYDRIGRGYHDYRRPDPRIGAAIMAALGDAETIINIGAGAGSYEPQDRLLVAAEPSATMIRQRPHGGARAVRASAMSLPFPDNTFDAAMAILTIHHWPDRMRGVAEMKRVTKGRCVILTWEPPATDFWLTADYFPQILAEDRKLFPAWFREDTDNYSVHPVLIPADCTDGFLCAYWQRPRFYLDPDARRAISSFSRPGDFEDGLARLRRDLDDGTWQRRHGHVHNVEELDLGYRLVVMN